MKNNGRLTRERTLGSKNNKWKGDDVGYFALHGWVVRTKGKAQVCVDCGSTKWVQWANISHKYKRDELDWKSLCSICHRRFDGITKFTKKQADEIKKRYKNGEKQTAMALELGVDQSTLSKIINNKIQYYG